MEERLKVDFHCRRVKYNIGNVWKVVRKRESGSLKF